MLSTEQFRPRSTRFNDFDEDDEAYLGSSTIAKMRDAKLYEDEAEAVAPTKISPREEENLKRMQLENELLGKAAEHEKEDAPSLTEQFPVAALKRFEGKFTNPKKELERISSDIQRKHADAGRKRGPHSDQNHKGLQKKIEFNGQMPTYFFEKQSDKHRKNRSQKGLSADQRQKLYMTPHEMREIRMDRNAKDRVIVSAPSMIPEFIPEVRRTLTGTFSRKEIDFGKKRRYGKDR